LVQGQLPGSRRFNALDGWRGICALLVAAFHFTTTGLLHGLPVVANAWMFVDFFFVLSGFVISHASVRRLARRETAGDFMRERFARLWPLHATMLGVMVVLEVARHMVLGGGPEADRAFSQIPVNLALLHGLGFSNQLSWNWPSWSISVEMAVYLAFAAFLTLPTPYRAWAAAATITGAIAVLAGTSPHFMNATIHGGLLRGLAGFFSGYLVYRLWSRRPIFFPAWFELMTVAAVAAFVSYAANTAWSFAAPAVFSVAILVFAGERGPISWALTRPIGMLLGERSYSIYLIHAPTIVFLRMAWRAGHLPGKIEDTATTFGSPLAADLITLGYLLLVCLLAGFTYRLIEKPGQELFRAGRPIAAAA